MNQTCKLSGVLAGLGRSAAVSEGTVKCTGAFPGEGCGRLLKVTKFGRIPTHKRKA